MAAKKLAAGSTANARKVAAKRPAAAPAAAAKKPAKAAMAPAADKTARVTKTARTGTATRRTATATPAATRAAPKKKVPAASVESRLPTLLGPFAPIPLRPRGEPAVAVPWLQRTAMQWAHIARNRRRWATSPALAAEQGRRARELLAACGVDERKLVELAHARVIQLAVPFTEEEIGWESRILPWEFVLGSATRDIRGASPLTVLRQLRRPDSPDTPQMKVPAKVLYVECAPGRLQSLYDFESERLLVRATLRAGPQPGDTAQERAWILLENPTRDALGAAVAEHRPEFIHLAGFDTHQGAQLLGIDLGPERDGVLMRDDEAESGLAAVDIEPLARLLTTGGKHRPQLVACSLWNSASRIAPMIIAHGARAAIGFQDTFDDALVEFFFASLYRRLRASGWDLADAFVSAWELLRAQPAGLQGTGLVLWSEAPLVGVQRTAAPAVEARGASIDTALAAESTVIDPATVRPEDVGNFVRVDIAPIAEMNYSLLHNRQPLLRQFKILSVTPRRLMGIDVAVELSAGEVGALYRRTIDLKEGQVDLTKQVHVPLTAPLLRGVRESVNSSLYVEVRWGPHTLYRETRRIQLLPADQWRFDDRDNAFIWLPSFVFPRDRAVGKLMEKAQRHVRVLRDDPTTGFEGYQAIDDDRDDPTEDIDLQVQAIWSAIVHEWQLVYTNPPPTYSRGLDSQRLRTPSTILRDRFGTCIDTSLLLASCLELIDVYPVIFLLNDHAFPGYWRSDEAHDRFNEMNTAWVAEMTREEHRDTLAGEAPAQGWVLPRTAYDEILRQIDEGHLVPIESTKLTENAGFWAAVEAARENFVPKRNFHSMLDIANARLAGVTPLPIAQER